MSRDERERTEKRPKKVPIHARTQKNSGKAQALCDCSLWIPKPAPLFPVFLPHGPDESDRQEGQHLTTTAITHLPPKKTHTCAHTYAPTMHIRAARSSSNDSGANKKKRKGKVGTTKDSKCRGEKSQHNGGVNKRQKSRRRDKKSLRLLPSCANRLQNASPAPALCPLPAPWPSEVGEKTALAAVHPLPSPPKRAPTAQSPPFFPSPRTAAGRRRRRRRLRRLRLRLRQQEELRSPRSQLPPQLPPPPAAASCRCHGRPESRATTPRPARTCRWGTEQRGAVVRTNARKARENSKGVGACPRPCRPRVLTRNAR